MASLAVIGGTGMSTLKGLHILEKRRISTPYGTPSCDLTLGELKGVRLAFLGRHGHPHRLPPHLINYRANIWALKELGVTGILAVNVTGGVNPDLAVGDLVINDQIIDYTYGREHTFFGSGEQAEHIDFTYPYDADLRRQLIKSGLEVSQALDFTCHPQGCYGATQGPRLETAAEVRRLARDGVDMVGMTGMPEAALAAELKIAYAAISLVVNPAAGLNEEPVDLVALWAAVDKAAGHARAVIELSVSNLV